ncbi:hypothetical protein [Reichenbachiella versicolor]|uniref:hypothetical protein n=1 Tax=Reichenbachiella versicolor TaxID=1821036 RepID=UPI000D6EAEB5|nr:hypothetical protein [Reichenbachiella versicolor]
MSIKKLLYIDDNKIPSQIDKLKRKLKKQGFELDETFINLGDEKFKKRNEDDKVILDKSKIHSFIKDEYSNEHFDIIASDYDFKDSYLDGYTLLKKLKNDSQSQKYKFRKAKFCLYSADQDQAIKKFDTPDKIRDLIRLKIDDFIKRENISEELTRIFLAPEKSYLFKEHITSYLEQYPDLIFNNVYPKFRGKKLSEIANEIDKDLPNGINFQKALVELTVAHLINLNDFEKE